jgi:hypothetical protein
VKPGSAACRQTTSPRDFPATSGGEITPSGCQLVSKDMPPLVYDNWPRLVERADRARVGGAPRFQLYARRSPL